MVFIRRSIKSELDTREHFKSMQSCLLRGKEDADDRAEDTNLEDHESGAG